MAGEERLLHKTPVEPYTPLARRAPGRPNLRKKGIESLKTSLDGYFVSKKDKDSYGFLYMGNPRYSSINVLKTKHASDLQFCKKVGKSLNRDPSPHLLYPAKPRVRRLFRQARRGQRDFCATAEHTRDIVGIKRDNALFTNIFTKYCE